ILVFLKTEGIALDEARFTLENFLYLGEVSTTKAFFNSFKFGILTTLITALLGYLVAYKIFRSRFKNKFLILIIMILPMWSNLLLRIEALGNIMEPHNILSDLFSRIGIDIRLNLKGTDLAVLIGLVTTYLPFMILPIYTALEKIDFSLEEAALDLGATDLKKFWKIIFPLSFKGIITGSILVFLPSLSGFAIPYVLGKGNIILIGNLIEQNFKEMNYNVGSLLAIIILVLILGSLVVVNKVDKEGETLL
ncbi:MAG: ABC transporter permease, partial [Bacilli bacterium]|nr:ABC transporter permease [Bacilli bacterium]